MIKQVNVKLTLRQQPWSIRPPTAHVVAITLFSIHALHLCAVSEQTKVRMEIVGKKILCICPRMHISCFGQHEKTRMMESLGLRSSPFPKIFSRTRLLQNFAKRELPFSTSHSIRFCMIILLRLFWGRKDCLQDNILTSKPVSREGRKSHRL
jgi:hypothetical protein